MKKLATFLFYFGLVLSVAGYFGDKADKFPAILRVLAPSYVRASKGIETLEKRGYLIPADEGFAEIERIFREQAKESGFLDKLGDRMILRFERKTAMIAFGESRAGEVVPVEVVFLDVRVPDWNMASIKQGIESLKETNLLKYSLAILTSGIVGLLVGRFFERGENLERAKSWAHRLALWRRRPRKKIKG